MNSSERRPFPAIVYAVALLGIASISTTVRGDSVVAATGRSAGFASAPVAAPATTAASAADEPASTDEIRLGFFPNITHATALVGVHDGIFQEALGEDVTLTPQAFNAGPDAITALFSGAIDAAYLGPNPAINGYAQSNGEGLRIISGATSGGAFLVVREGIDSPDDLAGAALATPQLGGTQDVALRAWLADEGYETDPQGGGDVSILPQENGLTLDAFEQGTIDGAWLPEPWASRLVEAGAHVLVDERDLWPDGQYVTTHLVVSTTFLEEHPDVVGRLLEGQVEANEFVNANAEDAQASANDEIEALTGKRIADATIASAWENLTFTNDPVAASLATSAESAQQIGLLDEVDLDGIYDLTLLNEVLVAHGLDEVTTP